MNWEDRQPRAAVSTANASRRRERDASLDPNSGDIKPAQRLNDEWRRPIVSEPRPEDLLNRPDKLLTEIRDLLQQVIALMRPAAPAQPPKPKGKPRLRVVKRGKR